MKARAWAHILVVSLFFHVSYLKASENIAIQVENIRQRIGTRPAFAHLVKHFLSKEIVSWSESPFEDLKARALHGDSGAMSMVGQLHTLSQYEAFLSCNEWEQEVLASHLELGARLLAKLLSTVNPNKIAELSRNIAVELPQVSGKIRRIQAQVTQLNRQSLAFSKKLNWKSIRTFWLSQKSAEPPMKERETYEKWTNTREKLRKHAGQLVSLQEYRNYLMRLSWGMDEMKHQKYARAVSPRNISEDASDEHKFRAAFSNAFNPKSLFISEVLLPDRDKYIKD